MNLYKLNIRQLVEDHMYNLLLSSGVNLEYYDHVIWETDHYKKVLKDKSFEFWTSGTTITLSNGVKKTILFVWEKEYDLPTASAKMKGVLTKISEDTLVEMSKRSLKQSLKRIRKTNINLN